MFVSVGSHSNVDDRRHAAENAPRRHPRVRPRRQERARLRLRHPQRRSASPSTRAPASSGPRSTSATAWATTSSPTTSRASRRAASTAGPGSTSARNQDPRHAGKHPELQDKVIVPDVLLQSHSRLAEMTFYDGEQFPAEYRGDIFAAEHGSWNRARRTGYKVIRVPLHGRQGDRRVRGLPDRLRHRRAATSGAARSASRSRSDGALLVSDDGGDCIWRVSYAGAAADVGCASARPNRRPPRTRTQGEMT